MIRSSLFFRVGLLAAAISIPLSASAADAPAADGPSKHVNLIVGQKMLDDTDWNKNMKAAGLPNMASQTSFGLETTWGLGSLPVSLAVDLLYSSKSGKSTLLNRTVTGSTMEFGIGARKVFALGMPVAPYVGGGLAYGSGQITCSGCSSDAATGMGIFLNGGALYQMGKINLGAGFRYSAITGESDGFEVAVGGINVNLVAGFGF